MRFTLLKISLIVFLAGLLSSTQAASLSDLGREKRWEEQIVPSLMLGEDVKLKANGIEFLALYAEASTDKPKGAVILLHGISVHPAWPDVIEPLRTELPEIGWHTLSLQMPILHGEAKGEDYPPLFPEASARIEAGVEFLKGNGINSIALSGHSLGSGMALYYLSTDSDPTIKAFAVISGGPGVPKDKLMDSLENFKKIKDIPIVDIYGGDDRKRVLDALKQREGYAKERYGNRYQTIRVEGANHFYQGKESELVNVMDNWLNKYLAP